MKPIIVVARVDTIYAREVVRHLIEMGRAPALILLGSRVEHLLFNLGSLRRVIDQLGRVEAVRRIQRARSAPSVAADIPSLADQAAQRGISIVSYDNINIGRMIVAINALRDPVVVLAGCGLVDRALLHVARGGCVNGHPAILPGIRGVDVVEWALVDDQPIGVTTHLVVPQVDAGQILRTELVEPEFGETYHGFNHRLVLRQAANLAAAALDVASGTAQPKPNPLDRGLLRFAAPAHVHQEAQQAFARRTSTPRMVPDMSENGN